MAQGRRRKVLVVDDSEVHRKVVRQLLEDAGHEVVEAGSGAHGISQAFWVMPDLIVSDVVMPEVSGYQLCRFLKNERATRAIPVILLTGTAIAKQDRFWGLKSGADRYLDKERVSDELIAEVTGLLRELPADSQGPARAARAHLAESDCSQVIRHEIGHLLDRLLFKTTVANEARRLAAHVFDEEKCFNELATLIESLTSFTCLCLHLVTPMGSKLRLSCERKLSLPELQGIREAVAAAHGCGEVLDDKEGMVSPPLAELCDKELGDGGLGAHRVYPVRLGADYLGCIALFFDRPDLLPAEQVDEHLCLVADEFATVARLLALCEENRRLSISDGLTSLFNFRYCVDRLEHLMQSYQRYGRLFSILIIDLDYFKRVNDVYGHLIGDEVLRQTAGILRCNVRAVDVVARYGGDEFVVLLPETDVTRARLVGDRIRAQIRATTMVDADQGIRLTASVGVTEISPRCSESAAVIAEADAALYEAKGSGRNAVHCFDPDRMVPSRR